MVKVDNSWPSLQQSAQQLVNLNCMSQLLEPRQEEYLPACGTQLLSANMALPRFAEPNVQSLRTEQTNEAHGLLHCAPPHFPNLLPAAAQYFREKQPMFSHGLCGMAVPNTLPVSSQKKLLVFDQCGTQTRLIYSSICPPITNPTIPTTKVSCHYRLHEDEHAAKVAQTDKTKSILYDKSAANYEYADESEMHEDTEEINALLYSDDEDDDYSDEDDEVRSTGQSPMVNIETYGKQHQFEEITEEEVSSSNFPNKRQMIVSMTNMGSYDKHDQCEGITEEVTGSNDRNKRQKLLNVGYGISLMDTASSVKLDGSCNLDNHAESSYAMSKTRGDETDFISGDKQARKENIRGTLKVLESIVPGTKGKDALSVLDDAIIYLNFLKLKATTLGVDSLLA